MKARPRVQKVADRPSFRLFLRVRHPSIDPAELTREFGTEPLHSFRAGDARAASGQSTGSLRHADSYWLAQVESVLPLVMTLPADVQLTLMPAEVRDARERLELLAGRNVGMAVTVLTMRLLQPRATLLKRLRAEEGEVTLLLELDAALAEPFTIVPQMLKLLADLGVTVAIEFGER
jgi:hypothetical protein